MCQPIGAESKPKSVPVALMFNRRHGQLIHPLTERKKKKKNIVAEFFQREKIERNNLVIIV